MNTNITLSSLGEKRLISEYIIPFFNPQNKREGAGDDCALICINESLFVSISTDRVPADLISFKIGIIDYDGLGYYLAALNISDIAASGGSPCALLLNLAFPPNFLLDDLLSILSGVNRAASEYGAVVLGGDLSTSIEMNIVATSVGIISGPNPLVRSGAKCGNLIFCSDIVGITPTAFFYFLNDNSKRAMLSNDEIERLKKNFLQPTPSVSLGIRLREAGCCTSAMDVTDGLGQSLLELADSSGVSLKIYADQLPIDPISKKLSECYNCDLVDLVLGAGADFQLVGTVDSSHPSFNQIAKDIHIIGEVSKGSGIYIARNNNDNPEKYHPKGWNYFISSP